MTGFEREQELKLNECLKGYHSSPGGINGSFDQGIISGGGRERWIELKCCYKVKINITWCWG